MGDLASRDNREGPKQDARNLSVNRWIRWTSRGAKLAQPTGERDPTAWLLNHECGTSEHQQQGNARVRKRAETPRNKFQQETTRNSLHKGSKEFAKTSPDSGLREQIISAPSGVSAISHWTFLAKVLMMVSLVNSWNEGDAAPRYGSASEIFMSCCVCELMETAQSLGDDTLAVVARPTWA